MEAKEYLGIWLVFIGSFLFGFPLVVALTIQATVSLMGASSGIMLISVMNYFLIPACFVFIAYQLMKKQSVLSLKSYSRWNITLPGACILLGLIVLVSIQYSISNNLPIFGWDAMDFWADRATALIKEHDMNDFTYDPRYTPANHRHPATISWLLALSSDGSPVYVAALGQMLFGSTVGLLLLSVGMALYFSQNWVLALLVGYLYSSQPLLENHALIAGYSEIWLQGCLMAGVVFALLWTKTSHLKFFLGSLLFMLLAALVKNIGIYLAISAVAGILLSKTLQKSRVSWLPVTVIGAVSMLSVISLPSGYEVRFEAAGWSLRADVPITTDLLYGVLKAIFLNQSFSILALFLTFILVSLRNMHVRVFTTYVCIVWLVAVTVFSAVLLLDYVAKFSVWGGDTLGSRLMLAPFCTVLVGMALAASSLESKGLPSAENGRKFTE